MIKNVPLLCHASHVERGHEVSDYFFLEYIYKIVPFRKSKGGQIARKKNSLLELIYSIRRLIMLELTVI